MNLKNKFCETNQANGKYKYKSRYKIKIFYIIYKFDNKLSRMEMEI